MDILRFARHLHTANHNTPPQKVSLEDLTQRYGDADAIVIEDHGHFQTPSSPNDADPGPMILPGAEWATPIHPSNRPEDRHHVGLMGVDAREQHQLKIQGYDSPSLMQQKVHLAGGVLVYNHPEYPYINTATSPESLDYDLPLEEARAFDAIEVFNDVGFRGSQPSEVLKWVERVFYQRGLYPAVVAGQDDHGPSPVAQTPTYTMAAVNERSENGLMDAIRQGRTYVSQSLHTEMLLELDGQSLWESQHPPSAGTHHLAVSIGDVPPGSVVEVVRQNDVISRTVASDGSLYLEFPLEFDDSTEQADYLYVRVWQKPDHLFALTSAVSLK